ncbi:putative kinase-like protein TMKL1 [Cynara cardunculus var. scolymus]|uniref:putative kinase-like protein TMKL1 n=1 Tax=Cynara cardunculus var. scolymus TaxID=59895 RepID=UPI000D63057B|nr:putative kinase-like protein TMKL1 [Cynara cardunculus var. scolymus]
MEATHKLMLILALSSSFTLFITTVALISCICRRKGCSKDESWNKEANFEVKEMEMKGGELIKFEGGEDLTCFDILDAPGEVIGKSSYGTLYRANLVTSDSVVVLRFLRPACTTDKVQDMMHVVQLIGSIRHPNLVPLCGFYVGPRGEKLLVHPFYRRGNLAQFIRDGNGGSQKWSVIYRISIGIARGLDHLHTGLQKPIIHGNLKSKNILLGRNQQPYVSDFGLHLLLNPCTAQEMVEEVAVEGYKPPEMVRMNDTSVENDIFNFGVILLELLTGKEPMNNEKADSDQDFHSNAILDHPISDFYHHDSPVDEEQIRKLSQLAMVCCSPSPSLRPNIKHICKKLQEIGSYGPNPRQ